MDPDFDRFDVFAVGTSATNRFLPAVEGELDWIAEGGIEDTCTLSDEFASALLVELLSMAAFMSKPPAALLPTPVLFAL